MREKMLPWECMICEQKNCRRGRSSFGQYDGGKNFWEWRVEERSNSRECHDFHTVGNLKAILEITDGKIWD